MRRQIAAYLAEREALLALGLAGRWAVYAEERRIGVFASQIAAAELGVLVAKTRGPVLVQRIGEPPDEEARELAERN